MKWEKINKGENRKKSAVLEVVRVSIRFVHVCIRSSKNVYTFSDLLEGLSVLRGSCSHSHILLRQSTRTDGSG